MVKLNLKIFKVFIQKKIIVIGVYREINSTSPNFSSDNQISYNVKIKNNPNELFYYVVTAPEEDFEVTSKDRLFVISPEYPDIDNLMENKIIIKMKI